MYEGPICRLACLLFIIIIIVDRGRKGIEDLINLGVRNDECSWLEGELNKVGIS